MSEKTKTPWLSSYGQANFYLTYPQKSMSDLVLENCEKYPSQTALSCMGTKISYKKMGKNILKTARAFEALGIRKGDVVTICLPNIPQAVYALYALNYIGAIANMIHPLSAEKEIVFFVKEVSAKYVITIDLFYKKFEKILGELNIEKLIVTGSAEGLGFVKSNLYKLLKQKKDRDFTPADNVVFWLDVLKGAKTVTQATAAHLKADDVAVMLFSGGTTGTTKGIQLTNLNFNALAYQTIEMACRPVQGKKMLAVMPLFHGFGLGVCLHTMMVAGGESILVPKFNAESYAQLIKDLKPNYIAGVPTLYEALTRINTLDGVNLDCLYGVFSGGDSLSVELKKKFDKFLSDHGATVHIREGYGTTECVTASCLTPINKEKEGSIGVPYPDTYYKICKVGTCEEVPYGEDGEICLKGPTVMKGYLNKDDENAITLRTHADGDKWLHTGDLGYMDEEGFIYFKQRIKRMIITSGYNVYPSQIENVIDGYEAVQMSCVIGVKDSMRIQRIKAFITLKPGYQPSPKLKKEIIRYCQEHVAKYAIPYDIEFREQLPKTLVGKIAYTVLEKEEAEKQAQREARRAEKLKEKDVESA
ncbi:MAG: class I adenylate-forming enzyme family protein [Christensenellaceae bacterium]